MELANHIVTNDDIIYLDETTFNGYMRQERAWQYRDIPVVLPLPVKRLKGVTLYGAIGQCVQAGFAFMTAEKTVIQSFLDFIEVLKSQLLTNERPILVLDQHRAHTSPKVRPLLEASFRVLWVPVSSCEFNSIEWLWAHIKRRFRKTLTQKVRAIKEQTDLIAEVDTAAEQVPQRVATQMLGANRKYIAGHLANSIDPDYATVTF